MEALAGLASSEDFGAVSLKKTEERGEVRELPPYKDKMLIQVKGRRHPQVCLIHEIVLYVGIRPKIVKLKLNVKYKYIL